ncbi:MAG: hypothetical protein D6694_09845 [Gammaproteobacteria bacterium]|nr:MAG: hypothetical protein D6694_09845 [Gammaproteobacteria bacterium]
MYVDAENVPQIINQRAEWWQIDRKKLFLMLPDADDILDLGKSKYQDKLYKMVAVINPGVIIIDSLSTISTKGESAVEDVRNILAFLSGIARGFNVPVLLIHHIKKRSLPGMKSVFVELDLEDLRGSSHIVAIGRTIIGIWQVQTTPDADDGPRKMAVLKSNLGAKPKALGFEMKPLHPAGVTIQWLDSPPEAYRSPTRIDECAEWLLGYLAEMGEPVKPNDVLRAATLQGFSRSTVYRARNALKDAITDTGPSPHAPNNAWKISDVEK